MPQTWDTASDWDAVDTESGVVHENFGDHDAGRLDRGSPSSDPGGNDLNAYWPLDDDSGTDITEVSGNSADGSLQGGTLGAAGVFGTTSISFGGSADYVVCDSPTITGTITISAWVAPDTLSDGRMVVTSGPYDGTNTAWEFLAPDGNGDCLVGSYDGTFHRAFTSKSNLSTGAWTHLAGRYDGSQWDIFVDGANATESRTSDQSTGAVSATGNRAIAATHRPGAGEYQDFFDGRIDEVQLYSRALSDAEIATLASLDWSYTSTLR